MHYDVLCIAQLYIYVYINKTYYRPGTRNWKKGS